MPLARLQGNRTGKDRAVFKPSYYFLKKFYSPQRNARKRTTQKIYEFTRSIVEKMF